MTRSSSSYLARKAAFQKIWYLEMMMGTLMKTNSFPFGMYMRYLLHLTRAFKASKWPSAKYQELMIQMRALLKN